MVLGNLLTGISLPLDRCMQGVAREFGVIETDMALGATRWEAARLLIDKALRTDAIGCAWTMRAPTGIRSNRNKAVSRSPISPACRRPGR
jgi:hypothetical protein